VTQPASGKPVHLPCRDAMRLPIHVDDIAEIFVRVTLAEATQHAVYNSGGETISLGQLADLVVKFLPDAKIIFEKDEGGRAASGNYLMDNTRLCKEFGVKLAPFPERVLQIINEVRREEGQPEVRG
jgi:nucleoside-diphosphate-sugar epimerase